MADQDAPTPGPNEFSADEERQMRWARRAINLATPPSLPITQTARNLYNSDAAKNAAGADATD
jgi:hypothetical protein